MTKAGCIALLSMLGFSCQACGSDVETPPVVDVASSEEVQINQINTLVAITEYGGQYKLYATLSLGAVSLTARLSGHYFDSEGQLYYFDEAAEVTELSVVEDPALHVEEWPGFQLEYGATVESLGIVVDVVGTTQMDTAATEYFGQLCYSAEGVIIITAFGDTVTMDTTIDYDDPDEFSGSSASSIYVDDTSTNRLWQSTRQP